MHIWLDPMNAIAMTEAIVATLAEADPTHAGVYRANGRRLTVGLEAMNAHFAHELAPLAGEPYIVFHDAYQYFESRYGLTPAGSITISPDRQPGAERLTEIRDKIRESGAICVFAEPQFEPRLVQTVAEGTDARTGVLDPLGAEIADGPHLYSTLINELGQSLLDCILGSS